MGMQITRWLKFGERWLLASSFALLSLLVLSLMVLEWNWRGTIAVPDHSLEWVVELGNSNGGWTLTMYRQAR